MAIAVSKPIALRWRIVPCKGAIYLPKPELPATKSPSIAPAIKPGRQQLVLPCSANNAAQIPLPGLAELKVRSVSRERIMSPQQEPSPSKYGARDFKVPIQPLKESRQVVHEGEFPGTKNRMTGIIEFSPVVILDEGTKLPEIDGGMRVPKSINSDAELLEEIGSSVQRLLKFERVLKKLERRYK